MVKLNGLPTRRDRRRRRRLDRAVRWAWRKAGRTQNRALRCRNQTRRERRLERVRAQEAEAYRRQRILLADYARRTPKEPDGRR